MFIGSFLLFVNDRHVVSFSHSFLYTFFQLALSSSCIFEKVVSVECLTAHHTCTLSASQN